MPSPLMQTISEARARWLAGDPHGWTEYVGCCLRLEAEQRRHGAADRNPERPDAEPTPAPRRAPD